MTREILAAVAGEFNKTVKFLMEVSVSPYKFVWYALDDDYRICYFHTISMEQSGEWEEFWQSASEMAEELGLSWIYINIGEEENDILQASYESMTNDETDTSLLEFFYVERRVGTTLENINW